MGAVGRRIFRLPGFTRLSTGRVLYITPSKNIKKFSQSDHGNINFESSKIGSHQRNWEHGTAAVADHQDRPKWAVFLLS